MPKFFIFVIAFCGFLYASMLAFMVWNWDKTRKVFSSGEGAYFVFFVAILLPPIMGVLAYYLIKIRPQKYLKVWKKAANNLGLEMTPNKFHLSKQFEDYKLEIAADAQRKLFTVEGGKHYNFSTIAAVKFEKPLPKEFKISKLKNKTPKQNITFENNEELSNAIENALRQNFHVFGFTNEGVFVQQKGIVGYEETLKRMALSVKNICDVIYKESG